MQKQNAKEMPRVFYSRHMVGGVAGYQDENILVSTDTIKKMSKSFEGKPVFVGHQDVNLENIQAEADGYVSDSFYNELDGWFWTKFVIVSDAGQEAIQKGWSVSNAYIPTEIAGGGTFLNMPFNREIVGGEFTHLAIVSNPRYEEACIMNADEYKTYNNSKREQLNDLKNSKEQTEESTKMLKFWKKTEVSNSEEIASIHHTLENGKEVSVADMIETVVNAKKEEDEAKAKSEAEAKAKADEKENGFDMEKKLQVGESEMTFNELVSEYLTLSEKKNAEDEEKEKDEVKKKEKENALENEKEAEAKVEAEAGKKHFVDLKNSISEGEEDVSPTPEATSDKIKRGKERY